MVTGTWVSLSRTRLGPEVASPAAYESSVSDACPASRRQDRDAGPSPKDAS